MSKNIQAIIIDPQGSFCRRVPVQDQQRLHDGELCVPGAWEDMVRAASLITRLDDKIDDIKVTLDSHDQLHISHPNWYRHVKTNQKPLPFTQMREEGGVIIGAVFNAATGAWDDVGEYRTVRQAFYQHTLDYLKQLKARNRYPHIIWPPHCLIGTPGHNIVEPLAEALLGWEDRNVGIVYKVTKGSNMGVEHFSAVRAEVEDPADPRTQLNMEFIQTVMVADEILLLGEARSHCLANTVRDIANEFADDSFIKKCVLLTDATSDVPGFEKYGNDFVTEMTQRGMRSTTTVDYLA